MDYVKDRIDMVLGLIKDIAAVFGVDLQPAIEMFETVWERVMDTIKGAWDAVWNVLKPGLDDANETIGALQPVLDALKKAWTEIWGTIKEEFGKVWQDMKPLFAELSGVIDSLKNTFGAMFGSLLGNIDDINVQMPAWQVILMAVMDGIVLAIQIATPIIVGLIKIIGNTIKTVVTVATEVISFFKNVFKGDWEAAFQDIKDIAVAILDGIKGHFQIVVDIITGIASAFGVDLPAIFNAMWDAIVSRFARARDSIAGVVGAIRLVIEGILNKISALTDAVGKVASAASTVTSGVGGFFKKIIPGGLLKAAYRACNTRRSHHSRG